MIVKKYNSGDSDPYFSPYSHMDPDLMKEYLQGENKPKYNAIKVGKTVEKIVLDFSSYESLQETSGVARFYTIHTAQTNQIGNKLGFHLGGFCDDLGSGGSDLAAEISGYEELPSDLFLCLMDNQYNFLPLSEKQLNDLYNYLVKQNEDTQEESYENYDAQENDLEDYVLFFKVNAYWPDNEEQLSLHYEYCYPLLLEKKPSFPFFDELFTVEGYDRIHETLTLKLKMGKKEEIINLKLDEEYELNFDYNSLPRKKSTHRVGTAVFAFRRFNFATNKIPGKIIFHAKSEGAEIESVDQEFVIDDINDKGDDDSIIELETGERYCVLLIDELARIVIFAGFRQAEQEEDDQTYFVPLWLDKTNEEYFNFAGEEDRLVISITTRYRKQ